MINNNIDLKNLKDRIDEYNRFIERKKVELNFLEENLLENINMLEKVEFDKDILIKVNELLKRTSDYARQQSKNQIERIVSNCLMFVFDSNLDFEIDIEELRGKPSAEFFIKTDFQGGSIRLKPEESKGGGVVDIVSLALRIAFLEIIRPKIEGPLILDEPAKHLSDEYIYSIGEFLKHNSEMFSRQIIMVTHNNHLAEIGSVSYNVSLENGESKVLSTSNGL